MKRIRYDAREVERLMRSAPRHCRVCQKMLTKGTWVWEIAKPISVITLTGSVRRGSVVVYECNQCAKDTP